jgi:hypothetical protein
MDLEMRRSGHPRGQESAASCGPHCGREPRARESLTGATEPARIAASVVGSAWPPPAAPSAQGSGSGGAAGRRPRRRSSPPPRRARIGIAPESARSSARRNRGRRSRTRRDPRRAALRRGRQARDGEGERERAPMNRLEHGRLPDGGSGRKAKAAGLDRADGSRSAAWLDRAIPLASRDPAEASG